MSAPCPICVGTRLVLVSYAPDFAPPLPRPCPRCCPAPPGRLLKSQEGPTLDGEALVKALAPTDP